MLKTTLFLFLLTATKLFSQTSVTDSISGKWYLTNTFQSDTLLFNRTADNLYGWGSRIELNGDNKFVDACSALCGNGAKVHKEFGTWEYNSETRTLITSIPFSYDHATQHRIWKIKGDWLIMLIVH